MPENESFDFKNANDDLPDQIHLDAKDSRPKFFESDKDKIAELVRGIDHLTKRVQVLEAKVRTLQRPDPRSLIVGEKPDETADRIIEDFRRRTGL